MYYIWLGIYEMYYMYLYIGFVGLYLEFYLFGVAFLMLVCVHENREPLDC